MTLNSPNQDKPSFGEIRRRGWGKRREADVMNALEQQYAEILREDPGVEWFGFEVFKYKIAPKTATAPATFWTPDFLVRYRDGELVLHEVKGGLFPEHNKVKLKVAAGLVPMRVVLAQFKNKKTGWEITDV